MNNVQQLIFLFIHDNMFWDVMNENIIASLL